MERKSLFVALFLALLLTACDSPSSLQVGAASRAWIDAPSSGAHVQPGTTVQILAHASMPGGVTGMELMVNGASAGALEVVILAEGLAEGRMSWTPSAAGAYALVVRAASANGDYADSAVAWVIASGESTLATPLVPSPIATETSTVHPVATPLPTPTATPLPTPTLTPIPTPSSTVAFWADATTVQAGSCTVVRWETANVQAVYLDGQGVVGVGNRQVCPCAPETYTLDVLLPDGSHDVRTLTIQVIGSCFTPTPSQDTTPPPAPTPIEPGSNDPNHPAELCGAVVLRWNAVSDPSGIQGYRVNLQWHDGSQWQSSPPYSIVYGTSADVTSWRNLHLYFPFRWAVWAIDNAGNHGPQSEWRYFECPLE